MARLPYGPQGPFIGKNGASVGYILNGQAIIRALPHKSNKPLTLSRKNNCGKMTVLNKFIKEMSGFLKITFDRESRGTVKNWHNLAIEYNNPNAIKGFIPDLEIDYSKVILSRGNLKQPVNTKVELVENRVKFSWEVSDEDKWNSERVMMMVYFPEDGSAKFVTTGAGRIAGEDSVLIEEKQMNSTMETFMTFASDDRQHFANSLYTGRIES